MAIWVRSVWLPERRVLFWRSTVICKLWQRSPWEQKRGNWGPGKRRQSKNKGDQWSGIPAGSPLCRRRTFLGEKNNRVMRERAREKEKEKERKRKRERLGGKWEGKGQIDNTAKPWSLDKPIGIMTEQDRGHQSLEKGQCSGRMLIGKRFDWVMDISMDK